MSSHSLAKPLGVLRTVLTLLVAAGAITAGPSPAVARPFLSDINLGVFNNSKIAIKFDFCPNGHVSTA